MDRVTLSPVRRSPGAPARPAVAGAVLLVAAAGLTWVFLRGDGGLSTDGEAVAQIVAAGALAVAGLLVALGVLGLPRFDRAGLAAILGLGGYAALAGISISWSVSGSLSRNDAFTAAAYLAAYLAAATLVPALGRPFTTIATATCALATVISAWALVARAFDATTSPQLTARLVGPIGIPNGLAMIALIGLLCGLALASEPDRRSRLVGGALVSLQACTLLLTGSRAGLLLTIAAGVILLVLLDQRSLVRFTPLLAALPGAAVGLFALTWDAFEAKPPLVPDAGIKLPLLAAAATLLGAYLALRTGEWADRSRRRPAPYRPGRRTGLAIVIVAVVAVVGGLIAAGGPIDAYDSAKRQVIEDADSGQGIRVASLSANQRDHWWRTAWEAFRDEPLHGHGAGTFRIVEQYTRQPSQPAASPHNTVLEGLAGLGIAGGVLIVVAGCGMLLAAAAGVRDAVRGEEAAAAVLALGAGAVLLHGLVDLDWDIVALGVLVSALLGALAPRGVIEDTALSVRAVAVGFALGAMVLIVLIVGPWRAANAVERSERADDPAAALRAATEARRLDARSVDALLAEADARVALGDRPGAEAALAAAIELEPWNYVPYFRQGIYRLNAWDDPEGAHVPLELAYDYSGFLPSTYAVLNDVKRLLGIPVPGE